VRLQGPAEFHQVRCLTASIPAEKEPSAVPESSPNFVTVKGWILDAATESNMVMSVRRAKKLAGDYLARTDPDDYLRITHSDPVGEGVARRWMDFKHNTAVNA
jgi:hypothetical protein